MSSKRHELDMSSIDMSSKSKERMVAEHPPMDFLPSLKLDPKQVAVNKKKNRAHNQLWGVQSKTLSERIIM